MTKKEFRHIRAMIELCIVCIFLLIFLFGLVSGNLECSVWGFIGGTSFAFIGGLTGSDFFDNNDYRGNHYDE